MKGMLKEFEAYLSPKEALKKYVALINRFGAQDLSKPEHKQLRELFQAIIFTYGINTVTNRRWLLRLISSDRPDFECCSPDMEDGAMMDCAQVESVRLEYFSARKFDTFSAKNVATFVNVKKLSKVGDKYDAQCIFGVYFDIQQKSVSLKEVSHELGGIAQCNNEVWAYGATNEALSKWFIAKIHPGFSGIKSFSVDWNV